MTWDDLPSRPWAENVEPPADELADYMQSLTREQLAWMLDHQRQVWASRVAAAYDDGWREGVPS